MRINLVFVCALLVWGMPLSAQAPLSAIDWLSQSVAQPTVAPHQSANPDGSDVVTSALPGAVTVRPLDAPDMDRIGIKPAAAMGLPDRLWGGSSQRRLLDLLAQDHAHDVPALRRLYRDLLSAASDAPLGLEKEGTFFLARVDALLQLGDLSRAQAMLDLGDRENGQNFRRWFDVALLTGAENQACARMRALPDITPTYAARIFCLARGGDWAAAALTLDNAEALGIVTPEDDALLLRFLDDQAEGEDALAVPPRRNPTPLQFALFEAIGEPLDTSTLPLAFAHADLRAATGFKARVQAAERLARAGAIAAARLWLIYAERRPAASGGVWDRVEAIQKLQTALKVGDPGAVATLLPPAWEAMQDVGLAYALAETYGAALARLPLSGEAARIARHAALLAGGEPPEGDDTDFVTTLANGKPDAARAETDRERAISEGFAVTPPPEMIDGLATGRAGEVLLGAMRAISDGDAGNLDQLRDGLATLRAAGRPDLAVAAALQLVLLERRS